MRAAVPAHAQERGHHQPLQCPGARGADSRGERGVENAGIDVVASGDEAVAGGQTGKVAQKSRRTKNGPGALLLTR